jgi:7-keto-8-aminopelargonate synthetase-like enzyme
VTTHSPILPLIVGEEGVALEMATWLHERDIFIPAIRFPSVPRGQARLRLTVTAAHTSEDTRILADALSELPQPWRGMKAGCATNSTLNKRSSP